MLKKGTKISTCGKGIKLQIGKYAAVAAIVCGLAATGPFSVCAEAAQDVETQESGDMEMPEQGVVLKAEKRTEMKASPEKTAETLMTFQAGDLIFAVEEMADGWYRVIYQDKEGYVEKDGLTMQEIDVEGLNAEMAANEAETKFVVEVVEKYRADARRSKIWGTIIILLVVSIFGVGIFSAIRSNQNEDDEKNGEKSSGKGNRFGKRKQKLEQIEIEDLN